MYYIDIYTDKIKYNQNDISYLRIWSECWSRAWSETLSDQWLQMSLLALHAWH